MLCRCCWSASRWYGGLLRWTCQRHCGPPEWALLIFYGKKPRGKSLIKSNIQWLSAVQLTMLHCESSVLIGKKTWMNLICSTQEEVLVSTTKIKFDISLVLKKSCLQKLATSPMKLLYSLAAIRSQINADKARPVDIQPVTDLRKTSF